MNYSVKLGATTKRFSDYITLIAKWDKTQEPIWA